jgi:hypothetical protein
MEQDEMKTKNWNCDGGHCVFADGEVRVYPLGGDGNLILCLACFAHENRARRLKGVHYKRPEDWPQVDWSTAERYPKPSISIVGEGFDHFVTLFTVPNIKQAFAAVCMLNGGTRVATEALRLEEKL